MAQSVPSQQERGNPKMFFVIAFLMLAFLALLSSLGPAFVYFFLGLAVFFIYMGIRALPRDFLTPEAEVYEEKETVKESAFEFLKRNYTGGNPTFNEQKKKVVNRVIFFATIVIMLSIVVAIFSDSDSDAVGLAPGWQQQADDYYNAGKLDSAYLYYHRLSKVTGFSFDGDYGLGNIMSVNHQYDSALFYYNRALDENPDLVNVRYGKAFVLKDMERYADALREVRTIIELDESYMDAFLLGGDAYYFQKKYDSALYYYEPAYDLGARSASLMHIMAYLYDVKGQTSDAIRFYKEVLSYDDSLQEVYARLGELLPGQEGNEYRRKAVELKN